MNKVSPKRLDQIRKGELKLSGRSTFKQMTPAEYRAHVEKERSAVRDAMQGAKGQQARSLGSKTDKQRWKAKADKWFSEFIRLRDSDEQGIATCITSGKRGPWRSFDAGHWISRAKESTRYDERNVNAQGKMHNRFQGGHFLEHGLAIDRKHGAGTRELLEQKAGQACRRTASDYQFIADTYKSRVDRIRELSPEKYNSPNTK